MGTTKTVYVCLFIVELLASILVSFMSYRLLKLILPYKDASIATVVSTLSSLWLVHVTLRTIQLLTNATRNDMMSEQKEQELTNSIREFRSKMNREKSFCRCKTANNYLGKLSEQCKLTAEAKKLIQQSAFESHDNKTRISISILAIFATVILQCSIRLFALLHSINRAFRARRWSTNTSQMISFFDVPFTIGKRMSLGGRSFFIFYFLDRWFDPSCHDDHNADNGIMLQSISFDQIAINSMHIVVDKAGRLGLSFGCIEFGFTIHLKQNRKTKQAITASDAKSKQSVDSISVEFRIESLKFGMFPLLHRIRARGLQFEANVALHNANGTVQPSSSGLLNNNTPKLFGVGMSHECNEFNLLRFCSRNDKIRIGSLLKSKADLNTVVSWDIILSAFYLHETDVSARIVSTTSLPSGSLVLHRSQDISSNDTTRTQRPHSKASFYVGEADGIPEDTNHFCRNRFAVGLDLDTMSTFILAINWLLQDIASSLCNTLATQERFSSQKKKPSIEIVAMDASFCSCVYFPLQNAQSFYFTSSNTSCCWRKTSQPASCKEHFTSPLQAAMLSGAKIRYVDNFDLDVVSLESMDARLLHVPVPSPNDFSDKTEKAERQVKGDIGYLLVRIDDHIIKKFAKLNAFAKRSIPAINDLKLLADQLKRNLLSGNHGSSQPLLLTKHRASRVFDQLKVSCSCIDAVIEMQPPHECSEKETSVDNHCLRVAILQRNTFAQVRYNNRSSTQSISKNEYDIQNKVPLPNALFECELQYYDCVCVTEADITGFEVSATFYPHAALPTINQQVPTECTFCGQASGLNLKLCSPSLSQVLCASINKLRVYELIGPPLLSISVHDFFMRDMPNNNTIWPMLDAYQCKYNVDETVEILSGAGKFCRVERNDRVKNEKLELMSIQLCRGASTIQIYWSNIFQWLQASLNERIQCGIEYIKSSISGASTKQGVYKCRKTRIRFLVDSNTNATFHFCLGKKTVMHTFVENGMDVSMSVTKHRSRESSEMRGMKPDISITAGRVMASLNDIASPTFVFGNLNFINFTRRATSDEVFEYVQQNKAHSGDLAAEIVTDWEGHPMKEIFDLNMGSCTAKFHPRLLFGAVIDDLLLTPRALDAGLDSLKGNAVKRERKYQLMSIKVVFSFLDISLLDDTSRENNYVPLEMDDLVLQDVARVYFESINVEIERNAPPPITQSQIAALDEDTSCMYTYGPSIQGGQLRKVTIDHVVVTLIPLNLSAPMVRIKNFDMTGFLFLTGISADTPGIGEGRINDDLLLCHHVFSLPSSRSSHEHHCGCYGISSHSSGIPVKLYTDCKVRCNELDVTYGQVMNLSIAPLMECIQRLLPPPQPGLDDQIDAPTPLTWWDNVRFFVHGNASIHADELSIRWLLDSQYLLDHSIQISCDMCLVDYNLGYFGFDATELNISLPGVSYDMSVHPSRKRCSQNHSLPQHLDTDTEERHPVIYIPSISTKITFAWKMLCTNAAAYSAEHHSPYVNCKWKDKFSAFRSDGLSVIKFGFELRGADLIGNWILLRIDLLPWFTHVNSTVEPYSTSDDSKSESLPRFHSVEVEMHINQLQLASWFTGNENELEDLDGESEGVCITVKSLKYTASGGNKDIVIEGPVKGALLDLSEFLESLQPYESGDEEMKAIENASQNYGRGDIADANPVDWDDVTDASGDTSPFFKLQELLSDINELNYVVNAGQIDIQNRSLESIITDSRTSFGSEEFAGVKQNKTTWSILVSQLKILWTLDIRDQLMALTQDLMYTTGFMRAQMRQSQLLVEEGATVKTHPEDNNESSHLHKATEEGVEVTLSQPENSGVAGKSMLEYLLQRSSSFDLDVDGTTSATEIIHDNGMPLHPPEQKGIDCSNPCLPTIDIHFSNPQIQLHRKSTGGSIILAMEGAHVEGRKFVRFLVDSHKVKGKVTPSDLTRRTEHAYTLTNMQAYSLNTRVDISAGLRWLEVCIPKSIAEVAEPVRALTYLEERFGIIPQENRQRSGGSGPSESPNNSSCTATDTHQYIYPPHLRHHEPLAFMVTGFCSPILEKFTFKSLQSFHRPPIHYSSEELLAFINQGLVSREESEMVDEVDLTIDLLHFTLDSYQFKNTFDILRNVLLEPPPHRQHRSFDGEENEPQTSSNRVRVSSVAAMEMEEVLASDSIHRGKYGREKLRSAAMNLLRDLEDRHVSGSALTRRVSYTLKKLKWCINSPDSIDNVEIAFTGFFGQHEYCFDGSVSTQFSLEDVRVSSTKPGPDAISFPDPTAIMKPVLDERSPCVKCGSRFDHSMNELTSCSFHDGTFASSGWSCCNANDRTSHGCKNGPHSGKERAALVRVEALPRIVEGITLYSHLEVNIFPEIAHTTSVQISKSLSKLFMNYFFVGGEDEEKNTDTFASGSNESISYQSDTTSRQKSILIGGKGSPRETTRTGDDVSESVAEDNSQNELVLIKVWRVGYINVEVSLAGFRRLPQRTVDIRVHDYSKAYKIGSWSYIGRKYLTYLVHETLRSVTGSAIFGRKLTSAENESSQPDVSLSNPSLETESESFLGRHFRPRPLGAETFLGTTSSRHSKAKAKPKSKVAFSTK